VSQKNVHPTREALITTTVRLLETTNIEDIKVEEILSESGVSTGSLYHHFTNLSDLIDHALIAQYAAFTDRNIDALVRASTLAKDRASLSSLLRTYAAGVIATDRKPERFMRAQVMARAASDERFRALLIPEQERLTGAVADLARDLQARDLVNPSLNPMAIAMFTLSYNIGLIVNDHVSNPVDPADLLVLISGLFDEVIISE
jgi:AcrR family transcriptional regulator